MGWVTTVVGVGLVAVVLREVFHTLFHPSGQGALTRFVMASVWRIAHLFRGERSGSALAGPLGMALVVLSWAVVATIGWTLIYFAQMPEGFSFSAGLQPAERSNVVDSLYLSLVTVATLGYGDIVPTSGWLRLIAPLEALLGFVLLTAAVSWVLQVYPALTRRRVLAAHLAALRRAHQSDPSAPTNASATDLLTNLAVGVVQARVDLTQYAVTYYFRDRDEETALPAMISYALELARRAEQSDLADLRLAGRTLTCAIDGLARVIDREFLRSGADTAAILRAYAADQRYAGEEQQDTAHG